MPCVGATNSDWGNTLGCLAASHRTWRSKWWLFESMGGSLEIATANLSREQWKETSSRETNQGTTSSFYWHAREDTQKKNLLFYRERVCLSIACSFSLLDPPFHSLSSWADFVIYDINCLLGMDPCHSPRLLDALSCSNMSISNRRESLLVFPQKIRDIPHRNR